MATINIITNTEGIKTHVPINKNTAWVNLKPFVLLSETKYIRPMLGAAYYAELADKIQAENLSVEETELVSLLAPLLANCSVYHASPIIRVVVSDNGIQEQKDTESTLTPASNAAYTEFRMNLWNNATLYRNLAFQYMQDNIGAFETWAESPSYTESQELFIRNNDQLSNELGMGDSVDTYMALRTHIKTAEQKYLFPILCTDFAAHLLTAIKEGTLTEYEEALIVHIKSASAWYGLYEAAPTLRATIQNGMLLTFLPIENSKVFQPIPFNEMQAIQSQAKSKAEGFIAKIIEYLDLNAADLPQYQDTTCYEKKMKANQLPLNTPDKATFGMY
jgi:hypothetical protein